MAGGPIVTGTYALVSQVDYLLQVDDAGAYQPTTNGSQTVLVNDGCMEFAATGYSGESFESVTYALNGDAIALTPFCGATDPVDGTYTATPTSLRILTSEGSGVQVLDTYLLQ